MASEHQDLEQLLTDAREKIQIVGVVPLKVDWLKIAQGWIERQQQDGRLDIIVLCESDTMLFEKAFLSDTEHVADRRSYRDLRFSRNQALDGIGGYLSAIEDVEGASAILEVMHLRIPLPALCVDRRIFVCDWLVDAREHYRELPQESAEYDVYHRYIDVFCDGNIGRKYAAKQGNEVLELYDHDRVPRGIFPRSSFYDTDFSQLVIWGLVFDRTGRMLIHRRSDNAKDNRSMWDKSVGGHVDFELDVDTSRAMARELLEELFTDEIKQQTKLKVFSVNDEDVINLGEWRPERRKRAPFDEISQYDREWAFFRLRDSEQVYSPRTLPSGQVRRLRVISDVFLFVSGPDLTDESLGRLHNSTFKLLELGELKTAMDRALRGETVEGFEVQNAVPRFSPDLVNIMTGSLRDTLQDFSQHIKSFLGGGVDSNGR